MRETTIGILYPGEMGSSLGKLLVKSGLRVVTTLEGRSPRTRSLCMQAGLACLESTKTVLLESDVVISLVTPRAALPLARECARLAQNLPKAFAYVDANSISPTTARQISSLISSAGVEFIDASIHGLASRLQTQGTLYVSGSSAAELSKLFTDVVRVKVVGPAPGQASGFKMIMAALSKGLVALFLQAALLAREMALLDHALERYAEYYPGVMEVVDRLLPTYPQHATRRAEELGELETTLAESGLPTSIVHGMRELLAVMGQFDWGKDRAAGNWTVRDVIEEVYRNRALLLEAPNRNGFSSLAAAPFTR